MTLFLDALLNISLPKFFPLFLQLFTLAVLQTCFCKFCTPEHTPGKYAQLSVSQRHICQKKEKQNNWTMNMVGSCRYH